MAPLSKEEIDSRIYDFAWHYVNTCGGNKAAAYRVTAETHPSMPKTNRSWGVYDFYENHKEKIEELIAQFRAENRKEYPNMRDSNIAMLNNIATSATRNADRISAIKELDSIMGYNSTNVNLQGKVDSDIEVTITNL